MAKYQTDYVVGRTCLCYSYRKLLRLPRRCFCCASVFLSFPVALGRTLCCCIVLFCLSHLRGGHDTFFFSFFLFLCLFRFSLCQRIWIASICVSYLSYPVRWQVVALSTVLTALQFGISVSWFCDHRACISLGGRIGTDTRCAGCRRVETTV